MPHGPPRPHEPMTPWCRPGPGPCSGRSRQAAPGTTALRRRGVAAGRGNSRARGEPCTPRGSPTTGGSASSVISTNRRPSHQDSEESVADLAIVRRARGGRGSRLLDDARPRRRSLFGGSRRGASESKRLPQTPARPGNSQPAGRSHPFATTSPPRPCPGPANPRIPCASRAPRPASSAFARAAPRGARRGGWPLVARPDGGGSWPWRSPVYR